MKKIIVIGGSGFIGSVLVRNLLKDNHDVRIIDKEISRIYPEITCVCDLRDKENLIKACKGYEIIYNLAAEHKDNVTPRSLYDDVNVKGAENACSAAEQNNIKKIIFTSSVAVYGFTKIEADENHPLNPFNDYGRTKMEAENVYKKWQEGLKGRFLTIIRPSVVFGPENRGNVYNLLKMISSRSFIMVGNGKNKKSMVFVENIAAFLQQAIQFKDKYNLFNYVDKPDFDMNELVIVVKKALGKSGKVGFRIPFFIGLLGGFFFNLLSIITRKKFPISAIRVKKFCTSTVFSSEKMLHSGFVPPIGLREGLSSTIEKEFK